MFDTYSENINKWLWELANALDCSFKDILTQTEFTALWEEDYYTLIMED